VAALAGVDRPCSRASMADARASPRCRWYSRSVDSTYLTGKRVFIFGDATHAIAAARVASRRDGLHRGRAGHLLAANSRARCATAAEALRRRGR
jgi:light-independent protochlorophyllide reductase subunit B